MMRMPCAQCDAAGQDGHKGRGRKNVDMSILQAAGKMGEIRPDRRRDAGIPQPHGVRQPVPADRTLGAATRQPRAQTPGLTSFGGDLGAPAERQADGPRVMPALQDGRLWAAAGGIGVDGLLRACVPPGAADSILAQPGSATQAPPVQLSTCAPWAG